MYKVLFSTLFLLSFGVFSCKAESKNTINLNKSEFIKKVWNYEINSKAFKYEGNKPAIIDFHAVWCGPCKRLSPIMEELAEKYKGRVIFYKIDIDQEKQMAQEFGIQSVPSILFIPVKGQPQMSAGLMSKEALTKIIEEQLLRK